MKHQQHLIIGMALLGTVLSSCRKEITLDLGNESNKVVIEAIVSEGNGPQTVRLTRSVAFEASNAFPAISNATVVLSDDQGSSALLTETSPGFYSTDSIVGSVGRTYHLNVQVDGTTYAAECRMPVAVHMDTLMVDSFPAFGVDTRIIVPGYIDPAGMANYYRFTVVVNGEKQAGLSLESDRFTDGNLVLQPLFMSGLEPESGDVVEVTMQCIAPEVYDYFFSMMQNVDNAATPADPVSNISGGALGYFSAQTTSTRSVTVP